MMLCEEFMWLLRVQRCGRSVLKMAAAALIRRSPCAVSALLYQVRKNCPYGVSQLPPQLLKNPVSCRASLWLQALQGMQFCRGCMGPPPAPTSSLMPQKRVVISKSWGALYSRRRRP